MFDLKKLKNNNAIFWVFTFPKIREIAYHCGWAIGVHGSITNDLDLMAMPWIENPTSADELAERIQNAVDNQGRKYVKTCGEKPNNRVVYTIFAGNTYIDMNIIENKEWEGL